MIGPERGRQDDDALDPGRDLAPDEGEVEVAAGAVGWVPQQAALYRRLTVEENLLLFARLERHEDPRASTEEMLELTGLGERRDEIVARLSGGNQQRINIAIGLLARPAVLLLDEPSVGLDPRQRARLWEFVSGLAGGGTTVIFSTHDIQEAERYGDRLLVLADGEALFDGSAEELREAVAARGARGRRPRLRDRLRRLPPAPGALRGRRMRWLLLKDLQILRRSPLQAVLLVLYPVLIAVLVGFAISRGPEKPRVAFLNEVPAERADQRRRPEAAEGQRPGPDLQESRVRPRPLQGRSRRQGRLGRRAGGADPARRPDQQDQLALDPDPGDAGSRSPRQRRRPGQGGPGQRPDHLAAGPGQPGDRRAGSPPKAATTCS